MIGFLESDFIFFAESGISAVKMIDVAGAAEVGEITPYRCFPTKTESGLRIYCYKTAVKFSEKGVDEVMFVQHISAGGA